MGGVERTGDVSWAGTWAIRCRILLRRGLSFTETLWATSSQNSRVIVIRPTGPIAQVWKNGIRSHFVVTKKTPGSRTRGEMEKCECLQGLDPATV